jgi:hypothetical protein
MITYDFNNIYSIERCFAEALSVFVNSKRCSELIVTSVMYMHVYTLQTQY